MEATEKASLLVLPLPFPCPGYLVIVDYLTNFQDVMVALRGELSQYPEKDQFKASNGPFNEADVK